MNVRPLVDGDRDWLPRFFAQRWGGEGVIIGRGRAWRPADLLGFAAFADDRLLGVVTYELEADCCEVVTIDAVVEGRGVGTALLRAVEDVARSRGCSRVQLVTTNNNLRALAFYQKRGYRLVGLAPGAVEATRRRKGSIPLRDGQGLPIRDELYLELSLASRPSASG